MSDFTEQPTKTDGPLPAPLQPYTTLELPAGLGPVAVSPLSVTV